MYNNLLIQSNYKPYIPPPKKKVDKDAEQKQPETKGQVVNPNNYNAPEQRKSSTDSFTKNESAFNAPKINITQLLIDFKSTLNAIGASEEIEEEVKTYLQLIENQSQKENPNRKMIISNLKIAADVLDGYITETLNKPSKVVKDWVDALLLQNIDFKADKTITKGAFEAITGEQPQTAKLAEKKLAEKAKDNPVVTEPQEEFQEIQSDVQLSNDVKSVENQEIVYLINKANEIKYSSPQMALNALSEAFKIAQSTDDKPAIAKIYSEIAKVQNDINNLPEALNCLNASTILAYALGDERLKTSNHKQMGRIYDDAGYMAPALSHYFASVAIDGELDDTENQADTLTSVGNMYSGKFIADTAVGYYKDALELAKVTSNLDMMSNIFTRTAVTFKNAGDKKKALSNLKNAAILSEKSGNSQNLVAVYEEAGDLMRDMDFSKRAADLYKKSYRMAEKTNDKSALIRLREKLLTK